jgi:hypothetical protein
MLIIVKARVFANKQRKTSSVWAHCLGLSFFGINTCVQKMRFANKDESR